MVTHEAILKTLLQSITEQCIWDVPTSSEERSAEEMTRVLFYISGLVDMAQEVIKMMEGTK